MVRLLIASALLIALLTGCGGKPASKTGEQEPLRLQLNWIPDAQHGGFYAAQSQGLFAAQGLEVAIVPGGPGTPAITKLATGRCDFAIGNADQVLLARQQGADVVAVFAAMQNSPRCIMVHESSGITSLDQLRDMTLALGDGKAFAEYMKSKLPLEKVRVVSYSGTVAKFLIDENFAQQGYVFSEPIVAKRQGGDPRALMVSDLGFNPYSSLLVVRRETLQSDPQLVSKVTSAVSAGWESYLNDPTAANQEIIKANREMDSESLTQSAAAIKPLCRPDENTELGAMTAERWSTLRQQLIDLKLLPHSAPPSSLAFVPDA